MGAEKISRNCVSILWYTQEFVFDLKDNVKSRIDFSRGIENSEDKFGNYVKNGIEGKDDK